MLARISERPSSPLAYLKGRSADYVYIDSRLVPMSRRRKYSGKRSGAWVFRGTRMPVSTVFENLQDMSIDELVEEFGVTREQVEAVVQFVAQTAGR